MYIPEPYFKNIPIIGNLVMDHIFDENGYPILFTCKNEENLYLCLCRTIVDVQKWIISKIDLDILEKMLNDKISIYEAFKTYNPSKRHACIAKWKKENPSEEYTVLQANQIKDEDLPNKALFLNDDGDSLEYFEIVKNRFINIKNKKLDSLIGSSDNYSELTIEAINYKYTNISDSSRIVKSTYAYLSKLNVNSQNKPLNTISQKKRWENNNKQQPMNGEKFLQAS